MTELDTVDTTAQMTLTELAAGLTASAQPRPEAVADVLREAILRGLYQGGQPLRQEELAAQLGTRRKPYAYS